MSCRGNDGNEGATHCNVSAGPRGSNRCALAWDLAPLDEGHATVCGDYAGGVPRCVQSAGLGLSLCCRYARPIVGQLAIRNVWQCTRRPRCRRSSASRPMGSPAVCETVGDCNRQRPARGQVGDPVECAATWPEAAPVRPRQTAPSADPTHRRYKHLPNRDCRPPNPPAPAAGETPGWP